MTRGLQVTLGLLRIAAGISLLGPGLNKLGWFAHPALEPILANWAQHAPNGMVVRYHHPDRHLLHPSQVILRCLPRSRPRPGEFRAAGSRR